MTPMINPTPTTCMAMSFGIPDREHAMGIRSREPPATPDAPHAARVRITGNAKDAAKATLLYCVFCSSGYYQYAQLQIRIQMIFPEHNYIKCLSVILRIFHA